MNLLSNKFHFRYYWNVVGASNDPCNDVFAGYSANDQLETKAIQQIILSKLGIFLYLLLI